MKKVGHRKRLRDNGVSYRPTCPTGFTREDCARSASDLSGLSCSTTFAALSLLFSLSIGRTGRTVGQREIAQWFTMSNLSNLSYVATWNPAVQPITTTHEAAPMSTSLFNPLSDAPTASPRPVHLATRHDYSLVTRALETEAANLIKLAKTTGQKGYGREARLMAADAMAIREHILPEFREQREMPLVTDEQVRAQIQQALRDVVRRGLVGLVAKTSDEEDEEQQRSALGYRENDMLEQLAVRIEAYGAEIAEQAFAAGYAARETDPETIASRSIHALSASVL